MPSLLSNTPELLVHLAVKDLQRSRVFFTTLGFEFEPSASDDQGACLVISDDARVMLLVEPCFHAFIGKRVCDATRQTEAIHGLSCSSRAEVDSLYERALGAGGSPCQAPRDYGFMYSRSFYDPDGHHWEMIWMDPAQSGAETWK